MSRGINRVILVGNVGKDPEVKFSTGGMAIAKFSLATSERRKNKAGEYEDHTEWHSLTAFGKTAEIVGEYVKKGKQLYVEGKLTTSSWDDKETGEKKYRTEINVNELVMLGGKGEGDTKPTTTVTRGTGTGSTEITDDDIPF